MSLYGRQLTVLLFAGEWLADAGYKGVQVSPPHEDIVVTDYPDKHERQEPWCVSPTQPLIFIKSTTHSHS